jgi:hypothetical protein
MGDSVVTKFKVALSKVHATDILSDVQEYSRRFICKQPVSFEDFYRRIYTLVLFKMATHEEILQAYHDGILGGLLESTPPLSSGDYADRTFGLWTTAMYARYHDHLRQGLDAGWASMVAGAWAAYECHPTSGPMYLEAKARFEANAKC